MHRAAVRAALSPAAASALSVRAPVSGLRGPVPGCWLTQRKARDLHVVRFTHAALKGRRSTRRAAEHARLGLAARQSTCPGCGQTMIAGGARCDACAAGEDGGPERPEALRRFASDAAKRPPGQARGPLQAQRPGPHGRLKWATGRAGVRHAKRGFPIQTRMRRNVRHRTVPCAVERCTAPDGRSRRARARFVRHPPAGAGPFRWKHARGAQPGGRRRRGRSRSVAPSRPFRGRALRLKGVHRRARLGIHAATQRRTRTWLATCHLPRQARQGRRVGAPLCPHFPVKSFVWDDATNRGASRARPARSPAGSGAHVG